LESLGKYFLELRLKQDISYSKISRDILIREEMIRKIEENRFFELGDYGVAKAIVYNYANYLEADLEAVMKEFKVMMPEKVQDKFHPRAALKDKKIMLSTNFLWMVGIIIFAIILGSILIHASRQGWLKAPNFFGAHPADSTSTAPIQPKVEDKPDTLRTRMRAMSEAIPRNEKSSSLAGKNKSVPADTTDYIGSILGASPLNVPLH
jgi:cytoskeletal protein RodZ